MPSDTRKNSPAPEAGFSTGEEELVRHLTAQLRALEAGPPVAAAVSGGGDSMALAHLLPAAARALDYSPDDVLAVTVDHGLRPESAQEAATVGRWMKALGVSHDILTWRGARSEAGLQAAARRARYVLMLQWCARRGVRTLLTAHTADDQAETVLMRLARGSGVDGLSGIAPFRLLEAADGTRVRLLRPLLEVPRSRLRACLEARGAGWLEDPSNENPAFDRVRARHALALLEPLGLSRARLVKTAAQMARARSALEDAAEAAAKDAVRHHPAGFAWIDPAVLGRVPRETGLRVLARTLMAVSGAAYRPRLDRLERALDALRGLSSKARTVGGCRLVPQKDGRVLICRELRAAAPPSVLEPGGVTVWDGRFRARLAAGAERGEIGPLGQAGLSRLRSAGAFDAADIPSPARSALPAFFRGGRAVAAPHLKVVLSGLEIERLEPVSGALLRFPEEDATRGA